MKIEELSYGAWPRAYRISNGTAEVVVTASAGPRIAHYGFVGGQNFFKVFPDGKGFNHRSALGEWFIMGGHRLWAAPELVPATYHPDNDPVEIEVHADGLTATPPPERASGLQKQIAVKMLETGTAVDVVHRITNINGYPVEIAAWVLTVMTTGGLGVTGFPPRGTHPEVLPPTNPLIMWAFTDFEDPRWKITKKYLTLRQDPAISSPQKLGHFNADTWAAYLLKGEAFVKRYRADPAKPYPDFGASFEIFANGDFLELETLGPLTKLQPGESLEHVERWSLHRGVEIAEVNDATLDRALASIK
ncbi:MAG: hypothetical protein SFV18_09040 [Bryobacteraceae bacterium]|nr:hypothetical protein [Bryobacteraceae bacterium]